MVNRSGSARVPGRRRGGRRQRRRPAPSRAAVARGARVVYQTLNPPYDQWTEEFPALQAGVLAAAKAHGARLVSMENVYMYGRPAGRPLTEDRDYAAHTKKGKLRGAMARDLLAAHRPDASRWPSVGPRTTSGRAAAPSPTSATGCSRPPWPAGPPACWATRTSRTPTPTSPTSARGWPCWASTRRRPAGSGTCPTTRTPGPPANWSTSSIGRRPAPGPGPAGAARCWSGWPVLAQPARCARLLEMQYQFEEPFVVDSSRITAELGVRATPVEQAIAETLAGTPIPARRPSPGLATPASARTKPRWRGRPGCCGAGGCRGRSRRRR